MLHNNGNSPSIEPAPNCGDLNITKGFNKLLDGKEWRPHGDSNPGYRRERAVS